MQISDVLLRAGLGSPRTEESRDQTGAAALERARLRALLPGSGISVAPPEAEDKLEISPLAHALLRAGEELDAARWQRVEALRVAYLRGQWEAEAETIAPRMLPGLRAAAGSRAEGSLEAQP